MSIFLELFRYFYAPQILTTVAILFTVVTKSNYFTILQPTHYYDFLEEELPHTFLGPCEVLPYSKDVFNVGHHWGEASLLKESGDSEAGCC